jgi:hypothetical protein
LPVGVINVHGLVFMARSFLLNVGANQFAPAGIYQASVFT